MPWKFVAVPLVLAATIVACNAGSLDLGGDGGIANPPIFVDSVLAPVKPSGGTCEYDADTTVGSESTGIADVSFASLTTYSPTLLIGNENAAEGSSGRTFIQGAVTTITDLAGDKALLTLLSTLCNGGAGDPAACATGKKVASGEMAEPENPFSTVESATIEPPQAGDPSYAAVEVTLVDGATIAVLRDYFENSLRLEGASAFTKSVQLLTYTQVTGTTLGGASVMSNSFEFPVTFTFGQLVSNLTHTANGYCVLAKPVPASQTCVEGQDTVSIVASIEGVPECVVGDGGAVSVPDAGDDGGDAGD